MFSRFGSWSIVLALSMTLILPTLSLVAQGEDAATPAAAPDQPPTQGVTDQDDRGDETPDTGDDTPPREGVTDQDDAVAAPTDLPDQAEVEPTSTVEPDAAAVSSLDDSPLQAAATSPVEIYCNIRDSNAPDQRIVGTFITAQPGYGDPEVTFTLYDLQNNVTNATGAAPPLPVTNPVVAPVTVNAPAAVRYEWGPGGFSRLSVVAVYPSLDLASVPDSRISLDLACVPTPPTPTPPPPATVDPAFTPPPPPTAASYTPVIVTEMKDAAGNTIPDGATVLPGAGIYDTAIISGLPPGVAGSVLYIMSTGNCTGSYNLVSGPHPVVADANGVAVAPNSAIFTVPGFPGGAYDWIVVYNDPAVGNVFGACGPETFNVPPPLPSSGTGNAILTCFLDNPPVPGAAGYGVNVDPLPATGTVQVNITFQLPGSITYEYESVTLPPGTRDQLSFSGPYLYAWVNVIFRDDAGVIYAVINLEGACTATPGPFATVTPAPTSTPVVTPAPTDSPTGTAASTPTPIPTVSPTSPPIGTSTATATAPPTPGPTNTPTSAPTTSPVSPPTTTPMSTLTATATTSATLLPVATTVATPTPAASNTPATTGTPTATAISTHTPETTPPGGTMAPAPTLEPPLLTGLPNTGSGSGGSAGLTSMLVAAAMVASLILWLAIRGQASRAAGPMPGGPRSP